MSELEQLMYNHKYRLREACILCGDLTSSIGRLMRAACDGPLEASKLRDARTNLRCIQELLDEIAPE